MERSDSAEAMRQRTMPGPFSWYSLALPLSERRALLIVGDILIIAFAGFAAYWLWQIAYPQFMDKAWSVREQMRWLVFLGITWLVLMGMNEAYNLRTASRSTRIVRTILLSALELAFLYLLLFFFLGRPSWRALLDSSAGFSTLPRLTPAVFVIAAPLFELLWRLAYTLLFTSALLRRRAIILGCDKAGLALARDIRQVAPDYELVGFIDDDPVKRGRQFVGLPVMGDSYSLVRLIQQYGANEVVLALTDRVSADLFQALLACQEMGVEIRPMPVVYEELLGRVPLEHLEESWVLTPFWTNSGLPTFYRTAKRLIDVGLALVGLGMLGIVLPFVALISLLEGRYPLLHREPKSGKMGRPFWSLKLRSTILQGEGTQVTRVGRFLRWTRLDELPQLLNVLKGDMSIVGPHAESLRVTHELQNETPFYRIRHSVKPGLTGWAQTRYSGGNSVEDALVELQYDLYYVKRQSLLLDVLIMLRTIKVMLTFRGT
jgi:lipopolysaccharide/colanic/teichoic acid biosynthesis glycosyltransferase